MNSHISIGAKGVSLIELLIYLAIFAGIMFVLIQIFIAFTGSRGQVEARVEVQQSQRFAVETMTQAIHRATGTNNATGASSTLSLIMASSTLNPTVFDTSVGVLRMQEGSATPVNLTSDLTTVTALTFTRITNATTTGQATDTIKIDITVEYKNNNKPQLKYSKNTVTTATIKQ